MHYDEGTIPQKQELRVYLERHERAGRSVQRRKTIVAILSDLSVLLTVLIINFYVNQILTERNSLRELQVIVIAVAIVLMFVGSVWYISSFRSKRDDILYGNMKRQLTRDDMYILDAVRKKTDHLVSGRN